MARLRLENISKSFGNVSVIDNVNLDIEHGEFTVLVGPSGCGKSTLLRLITGLENASNGSIFIDDVDVTNIKPARREVAMVFQSYALFPHMNVAQNIGFGLQLAKLPKNEIDARVLETAKILRVENLLDRKPRQLSGGQRQRVAIGRSIIRNPKVFLFDEPLSNLDAALRVLMRLEITRLHKRLGATMVFVTHDQTEAMTLANRIVVINAGIIEQMGPPVDLYNRPENQFVAGFIGSPAMNFIDTDLSFNESSPVMTIGNTQLELDPSLNALPVGQAILGIRPEHIAITELDKGDFNAEVEILEHLGAEMLIHLNTEMKSNSLTLRTEPDLKLIPGERIGIKLKKHYIHLFSPDGIRLN